MKHRTLPEFWDCYAALLAEVKKLADENFELLKSAPRHPSLHFKKVNQYGTVRVGIRYRAVAFEAGEDIVWFWIGTHAKYDQFI